MRSTSTSWPALVMVACVAAVAVDAAIGGLGDLLSPMGSGVAAGTAAWAGGRFGQRRVRDRDERTPGPQPPPSP